MSSSALLHRAHYASIYSPGSPDHFGSASDDDKPLDFSAKPNSPKMSQDDPIALVKSDFGAKFIKEHCFSTPSPSPPERIPTSYPSLKHEHDFTSESEQHMRQALLAKCSTEVQQAALVTAMLQSAKISPADFELIRNLTQQQQHIKSPAPAKLSPKIPAVSPQSFLVNQPQPPPPVLPPGALFANGLLTTAPPARTSPFVSAPETLLDTKTNLTNSLHTTPAIATSTTPTKYPRPFKAFFTKESLGLTPATLQMQIAPEQGSGTAVLSSSEHAYHEFRKQMLSSKKTSGGRVKKTNLSHSDHSDDNSSNASITGEFEGKLCEQSPASSTSNGATAVTPTSNSSPSHSSSGGGGSRKRGRPLPEDLKDEAYWERRRKNNEAAKRSRDLRRAKEDEIAIRAAFLERENMQLKMELIQMRFELDKIRTLWQSTKEFQQQQQSLPAPLATPDPQSDKLVALMTTQIAP